jgi:hypothetical protein
VHVLAEETAPTPGSIRCRTSTNEAPVAPSARSSRRARSRSMNRDMPDELGMGRLSCANWGPPGRRPERIRLNHGRASARGHRVGPPDPRRTRVDFGVFMAAVHAVAERPTQVWCNCNLPLIAFVIDDWQSTAFVDHERLCGGFEADPGFKVLSRDELERQVDEEALSELHPIERDKIRGESGAQAGSSAAGSHSRFRKATRSLFCWALKASGGPRSPSGSGSGSDSLMLRGGNRAKKWSL